jgi:hypothetical protein
MGQSNLRYILSLLTLLLLSSNLLGQGLQIYLARAVPDLRESAKCNYCFEVTDNILFDTPLLEHSDIEYFDWENQTIHLKQEGKEKIKKLKIPLPGLAAAIVVDGKPIYGFWQWNEVSSFGCDRVYTYPMLDFKLEFGWPEGETKEDDPRFDSRIKESLIRDQLMK